MFTRAKRDVGVQVSAADDDDAALRPLDQAGSSLFFLPAADPNPGRTQLNSCRMCVCVRLPTSTGGNTERPQMASGRSICFVLCV